MEELRFMRLKYFGNISYLFNLGIYNITIITDSALNPQGHRQRQGAMCGIVFGLSAYKK